MLTTHKFNHCKILGRVYPPGSIYLNYRWDKAEKNDGYITFDKCKDNVIYRLIRKNGCGPYTELNEYYMFFDGRSLYSWAYTPDKKTLLNKYVTNVNSLRLYVWEMFVYKPC